jgi:hypothetical protein
MGQLRLLRRRATVHLDGVTASMRGWVQGGCEEGAEGGSCMLWA